ncbi:class I SAM-dependent methyltransferase [Kaarinaea lacus]
MTTEVKDSDQKQQTVSMLAKHHGDGDAFAQLMEETYENRFNDEFWRLWDTRIVPGLSTAPLVVDFGTGPGTFVKELAVKNKNFIVYGVECAPYMLNAVGKLPDNAKIIDGDLQDPHLPLEDSSVDVAVSSVVVHEMIQPVRMFKEIQRVLKPGAKFYIYDWVRASLESYLKNSEIDPYDDSISQDVLEDLFVHFIEHNRFSLDDLIFMLKNTNFNILESGQRNDGQHAWILAEKPN